METPYFILAFALGACVGLTKVPPPKARRTTRLLVNNYLNNIGKTSAKFANGTAACIFLYLLTGKFLNYMLLEELEHFNVTQTQ